MLNIYMILSILIHVMYMNQKNHFFRVINFVGNQKKKITVATYWLFAYKNSLLQAHQRSDVASKISIITNTLQYGIQLLVLWLFHSYYLYVITKLTSHEERLSTSLITPILLPSGECLAVVVYIR